MKHGMIERTSGNREWWYNGKRHRKHGPAIELANGHREWWYHGKRHRSDGPAVEYANGHCEWWFHGKQYTLAEWLKCNKSLDSKTRMLYMLRYSEGAV